MGYSSPDLIPYKDYAKRLLPFFNKVEFHHIPRDENQMADALETLAFMYQVNTWNDIPQIMVRRMDRPAHVFTIEEVEDEKPWYYDINHFLQTQEYPIGASNKDIKTLIRLAEVSSSMKMCCTREIMTWSCSYAWISTKRTC